MLDLILPAIGVALSLAIWMLVRIRVRTHVPYPPGPSKHFILGNLLDMPTEYEYLKFQEWSKIYGPIMHLCVFGRNIVVLDSLQVVQDLMDKRALIYSDRPHMTMLQDVIGWDWSVVLFNYGKKFIQYRRIIQKGLRADTAHYQRIQQEETFNLLLELKRNPSEFLTHIEQWSKAVILRVTYGYRPSSKNDRYIWLAERCVEAITKTGQPGAYMVDIFPFLKWVPSWFPFAGFKREARIWNNDVCEVLDSPMTYVKKAIVNGTAERSYVSNLLEMKTENHFASQTEYEQAVKGFLPVYSIIQSFILAMALYPDVQLKAQAEIDRVIGQDRLPNFSDRPELPYIEKVLSELLRWARAVPLGIAHQLKSEDIYNGMFLPAGSIVIANVWSISRDEKLYNSPDSFLPERFEKDGVQDPRAFAFGFGRRACAGKELAESSIWIAMVNILAGLSIVKSVDLNGHEITPAIEYSRGLICKPEPFVCNIQVRGDRKAM
ncbi:cytochrome P450 [Hysterangium stoloniferum]|nr:cytochrome P450 [Hysterangium stoloniferum]